jgi:hypothetical protein
VNGIPSARHRGDTVDREIPLNKFINELDAMLQFFLVVRTTRKRAFAAHHVLVSVRRNLQPQVGVLRKILQALKVLSLPRCERTVPVCSEKYVLLLAELFQFGRLTFPPSSADGKASREIHLDSSLLAVFLLETSDATFGIVNALFSSEEWMRGR